MELVEDIEITKAVEEIYQKIDSQTWGRSVLSINLLYNAITLGIEKGISMAQKEAEYYKSERDKVLKELEKHQ